MFNLWKGKKAPFLVRLLNILIVAVALVAAFVMIRMTIEIREAYDRDRYSSIEYYLQDGEYSGMIREYYRKYYDIAPFKSTHGEAYNVAQYADAVFQSRLFEAAGDRELAKEQADRAESARNYAGSLSVTLDDIDRLLEHFPAGN